MTAGVQPSAASILARRLGGFVPLSPDEAGGIERLSDGAPRTLAARRDLIREGDVPQSLFLIERGWACRYKTLADGRRQILSLLLPGDLCDLNNHVLRATDHAIGALTPIQFAEIGHDRVAALAERHPRVGRALWWQFLVGVSVQREWTLNNGQRSALERLGHLFCETHHRLRCVGLAEGAGCAFPLTQNDLAEATGLTPVHINRTLQEMRGAGLIVLKERVLEIPDLARLEQVALFTPDYLHMDGDGPQASRGRPRADA